jgi:hypothetical protein
MNHTAGPGAQVFEWIVTGSAMDRDSEKDTNGRGSEDARKKKGRGALDRAPIYRRCRHEIATSDGFLVNCPKWTRRLPTGQFARACPAHTRDPAEVDRRRKALKLGPAARAKAAAMRREPATEDTFDREIETLEDVAADRQRIMQGVVKGRLTGTAANAVLRGLEGAAKHLASLGAASSQPAGSPSDPRDAPTTLDRQLTREELDAVFAGVRRDLARGVKPPEGADERIALYLGVDRPPVVVLDERTRVPVGELLVVRYADSMTGETRVRRVFRPYAEHA